MYTKLVFVPGKSFQSSLTFAGETGAYPSFKCSTLGWAPDLTREPYTRLESLTSDKYSS